MYICYYSHDRLRSNLEGQSAHWKAKDNMRKRRDAMLQNVTTHCEQVENVFLGNAKTTTNPLYSFTPIVI